jgi:hypothetical protein
MIGKTAYRVHRHTGRMIGDGSMRMGNRAESGFGLIGLLAFMFILGMIAMVIF